MSAPATFTYRPMPMRVRFGPGALSSVGEELGELGLERVLVVSTPQEAQLAQRLAERIGPACVDVHAEAQMHVPAAVARRAGQVALDRRATAVVAVGGGSSIGLAKAIALHHGLPVVAVPTTYAGSEMTPIWGVTDAGVKQTGRDARVLPVAVVYDPVLTYTLPPEISGVSGVNAIAHAVEALYAPDGSPIVSLMAAEGIRALSGALPTIMAAPSDPDARIAALYGAWLCGACLGNTTMSLHHKLCHVLGGTLDLPHAPTHAVVLPYAAAYNAAAAPGAMAAIAGALGTDDAVAGLRTLATTVGAPASLADLGMAHADVERAVELVTQNPYANPAPVSPDGIRALLLAALRGDDPAPRSAAIASPAAR